MRLSAIVSAAVLASACSAARACELPATACLPAALGFPAYTPEGVRIGTVEARVRPPYRLERSPSTGQPIPVLYNHPSTSPGSVAPELVLVPLPRVGHFHTQAVYPRGY